MAAIGLADGAVLVFGQVPPTGMEQCWLPSLWGGFGEFTVKGAGVGSVNPLIIDVPS